MKSRSKPPAAPKSVALPHALKKAFAADPAARAAFTQLAPSHRREYIQWIEEARTEQARLTRIAATIELAFTAQRER